jgi:hypothetical protein
VLGRLAAWLITGPLAFLIAGVLDLLAFFAAALRARYRARCSPPGGEHRP